MEQARPVWTDERLDDLSRSVDRGFDRTDADLRALRTDMADRFDSLHRLIIQVGGGMFASVLVAIIGIVVTRG